MGNQSKHKYTPPPTQFVEFGGKIPPQAIDLEKAVLGAILNDSDAILLVTNIINAGMFYNDNHGKIYQCMESMASKSEPIDLLTLTQKLKALGLLESVGGAVGMTELSMCVSSSANIEFHARILAQKYIARKIIETCSLAISKAYSDEYDIFEVVDELGNGLVSINDVMNGANEIDWRKETENQVTEIYQNSANGITSTGIKTGLNEFDSAVAGIRPGFYIIGGRPSMGKTAFALDITCRILENTGGYVGFFSLEMPTNQLINRILARESLINQTKLINSNINSEERAQLMRAGGLVSDMKILVNDDPAISILQIQSQAKVWANKHDLKAIVIDYLQLVKATGSNQRHLEVGEVSRGCKVLSKILDIPVFGLCQLGREKDSGKSMPQLSELRESGSLEQDADTVMLLYRPEYYGIEFDSDNKSTKGLTKVIIPKNRNGSVHIAGVNIRSRLDINRYYDWDSFDEIKEPRPIDMRSIRSGNEDCLPF